MKLAITNFKEEFSSKLPALTLLSNLGYEYLPPDDCNTMRSHFISSDDSA